MLLSRPLAREWEALLRRMLAQEPERRPAMGEVARDLQRLARGNSDFGVAVDGWLRRGSVPAARKMVALMNWAENARYLTEDEQLFLRRAPVQRLRKFRRAIVGGLLTGGVLIGGATLLISTSWYQKKMESIRAAWHMERAMEQQQSEALAERHVHDRVRSNQLANQASEHQRRLEELENQLKRERSAKRSKQEASAVQLAEFETLRGDLDKARRDFTACSSESESFETRLKAQRDDLERCEVDQEQLFLCRQESAVKDRELIEGSERLRLCRKQVTEGSPGAPEEVCMR
jgi:hypothetical protein